ncbi:MAG: hydroxyacid dehydrogenase [Clostridia bacterium]|nr:hydroxyacid dehydrogenase [Clostridia bacterium]
MKLLITGAWKAEDWQLDELRSAGYEIIFMQDERGELAIGADSVDGIICNGLFLYHDISSFKNLKYIQLTSAGFDRVPMDYVNKNGIEIHNARGVYSVPMAEYAVSGALQLYKQSRFFADKQRACKWEKHRGLIELFGKTVCIVGCGSVGTECAKRFSAFECCVIGVDLYPRECGEYSSVLPIDELDSALEKSDIVVLTLPLTEQTCGLIGSERLKKMKKEAILINIARGAVVDTNALIDALNNGIISGAVLDVFDTEPLDGSSSLWDMEQVILTPHNSFVGDGNARRLWNVISTNLRGFKK